MTDDLVVIGGGVMGLMTAYHAPSPCSSAAASATR